MKKRMRKAVAIAATAAMVGSLPMSAVTTQAADDDITIGVSIWSSTDVLGSQSKKIIDKAADALGVNVMYVDQGHAVACAAYRSGEELEDLETGITHDYTSMI